MTSYTLRFDTDTLWNVLIMLTILNQTMQAKDWIKLFMSLGSKCEGFHKKRVTPYMHLMVYHIPVMIKEYGNIKQFHMCNTDCLELEREENHTTVVFSIDSL